MSSGFTAPAVGRARHCAKR